MLGYSNPLPPPQTRFLDGSRQEADHRSEPRTVGATSLDLPSSLLQAIVRSPGILEDGLRLLAVDQSRSADAALALGIDRHGRMVVICVVCGRPDERHVKEALKRAGPRRPIPANSRTRVLVVARGPVQGRWPAVPAGNVVEFREYGDEAPLRVATSPLRGGDPLKPLDPWCAVRGSTVTEVEIESLLTDSR